MTPYLVPTNAVDAFRLSRSFERAQTMQNEGYTFWQDREIEVVHVCKPGDLHASYTIGEQLPGMLDGCSCPDYQRHGGYCKHTLCWDMVKEEEMMWQALCAEEDFRALEAI